MTNGLALVGFNSPSESHSRLILQIRRPPGFNAENYLGEKTSVQVIKQNDQIKPCGFKFVLGSVSYEKVELDVKFKGGLGALNLRKSRTPS